MKKVSLSDWVVFVVLTLIWGSSFILMKKGMEAFSASQVAAIRIFLAGVVLAPVAWIKRKAVNRRQLLPILFMGLCGSAVPAFLFTEAETRVSSSLAGILNSLTPFFILLIGILFFKFKYKPVNAFGIFVGFLGSALLVWFGGGLNTNNGPALYALLIVLATLLYGMSNHIILNYLKWADPVAITSMAFVIIAPFAGCYLFSTDVLSVLHSNSIAWQSLGYTCVLSLFGTALALILYNYLLQRTGALLASTVTYLMPAVALLWGIMAGESIGAQHILSMLLILVGVYLVRK